MIEIKNLKKNYGNKQALEGLNLTINDGEIFCLIGHNGAGKSTTIKSLVSIIEPTHGEIIVNGLNIKSNRDKIKRMIGYVPDSPDIFLKMQVLTYWKFLAGIYNIDNDTFNERLQYLCKILSLETSNLNVIEELSHGMRQKVIIIGALISNPKIWILDEPLTGLDPKSAFNLKELIKEHVNEGNTVVFSTHILDIAEQLCDRLAILSKGKLLFIGTMNELKEKYSGNTLEEIYIEMIED